MKQLNLLLLVALVVIISLSLASCRGNHTERVIVNYTVYRLIDEYGAIENDDLMWEPQYTTTGQYRIRVSDSTQIYKRVRSAVWTGVLEINSKYIPDSIQINHIARE